MKTLWTVLHLEGFLFDRIPGEGITERRDTDAKPEGDSGDPCTARDKRVRGKHETFLFPGGCHAESATGYLVL